MSIFKRDREIKRMIFNVYADLAEQLETLKVEAKRFDKRLDVDAAVNKALDKFIKKAVRKIEEMKRENKDKRHEDIPEESRDELAGHAQDRDGEGAGETPDPAA